MTKNNPDKEKVPYRKWFVASVLLLLAAFGLYNMLLDFLKYLGVL